MAKIRYVELEDKCSWFKLDKHLSKQGFIEKVNNHQGYVLVEDARIIGILRYNLFWDEIPFCTMLFIDEKYQGKGYGKTLMNTFESDMKSQGYSMLMTSTRIDENAKYFYRKLGYKDCGNLDIKTGKYAQPTELFMLKEI